MINIQDILKNLSQQRPIFHSKADFQHSLAWAIQQQHPEGNIRLETNAYGKYKDSYLDILVNYQGKKYAIELTYKTKSIEHTIDKEEYVLPEQAAQEIVRYEALKDLERLEQMVLDGLVDHGALIFLTNDAAYSTNFVGGRIAVDHDFRVHEGREINGQLNWREQAGKETVRGKEDPIEINGNYKVNWKTYSKLDSSFRGEFLYLLLSVGNFNMETIPVNEPEVLVEDYRPKPKEKVLELSMNFEGPTWFNLFSEKGMIPKSQFDLRDKLVDQLRDLGYSIEISKWLGTDKVDIFATKNEEKIAIEVRYKTALLQTIHEDNHIYLKNQGAQDISRYDYVSDLGKLERVVKDNPGTKGYSILLTNDHLYWKPSTKENAVDNDFHIYDGRIVTGTCSWSEEASKGTISGREEQIIFDNSYHMKWQPYLVLGNNKNEEFRVLLNEVMN
jgi:hypothetical protein